MYSVKKFKIVLTDKQFDFVTATNKVKVFVAGRSSGKSWAQTINLLCEPPKSKILFISATYPMLRDICWANIKEMDNRDIRLGGSGFIKHENKSEMSITLKNGTTILYRSADNPDRLRGHSVSHLYIDEAAIVNEQSVLLALACVREGAGRFNFASTPAGMQNWLYKRTIENPISPDIKIVHATSQSNQFLPQGFFDILKSAYCSNLYAQEVEAKWIELGALIDRDWLKFVPTEAVNSHSDLFTGENWGTMLSVDPAISKEPTADYSAISVLSYNTTTLAFVVRDMVCERLSFDELLGVITEKYREFGCNGVSVEKIGVGHVLYEQLGNKGFNVIGQNPKTNKLERAGRLLYLLEKDRVRFSKSVENTEGIYQLLSFSGKNSHIHDDMVDSLSYAINYACQWLGTISCISRDGVFSELSGSWGALTQISTKPEIFVALDALMANE